MAEWACLGTPLIPVMAHNFRRKIHLFQVYFSCCLCIRHISSYISAPAKSKLDTCCCSKNDNGVYEIAVKWHGDRHCDWFEVEVRYGEESKLESKLSIGRKTEITHHCIHAALQYSVKVRAKNCFPR